MPNIKLFRLYFLSLILIFIAGASNAEKAEIGDNGLHIQSWFMESFLDIKEDHETASGNGKYLAVIFEQKGCPYCYALHNKNFADDKIVGYLKKHFEVLQLDLKGSRKVTDFNGKEIEERRLAKQWKVYYTPTMIIFPKDNNVIKEKNGQEKEVFRMLGYYKPDRFMAMLRFVKEEHFKKMSFQEFLDRKLMETK